MSNPTQQLKAKQRREKFADLLREMFQLNKPELDFGLYRIMHARKDDINRFIEQDLPDITQKAFSEFASQDQSQLQAELEKARKAAEDAGFNADESPKVKELEGQLKGGFDLAREEGEVYDALVTFFSRYYSEGDFLSHRVYKDGTYAIPYQGEEVVLHWANKDQYYIKSSENLRDYSFRLNPNAGTGEDPMRVHFKLVDAEAGAKDNNKESADSKRVFVLDSEQPFVVIDGEPGNEGEVYPELQCRFFFRAATEADWTDTEKAKATETAGKKPPSQDALRAIAVERLLGEHSALPEPWKAALGKPYRKADGELADYSMLNGQLNNYTKKNTFDYFIHKDLGGFLTRELDFYIKNELLDWADIASLKNDSARLGPLLSKIEVIRSIGGKIINFLAQLENFQKKLWLKKKFVTETNYCITLDRLENQSELLTDVFGSEHQLEEWKSLYRIDLVQLDKDLKSLNLKDVVSKPEYKYLVLDTRHFDEAFKLRLISGIEALEKECDGLLINSENFQALSLIREKFKSSIDVVYIDPPYNTEYSKIAYKNNFEHSSWLSLLANTLPTVRSLFSEDFSFGVAIDDYEFVNLAQLLDSSFPELDRSTIVVNHHPQGSGGRLSRTHEYYILMSDDGLPIFKGEPLEDGIEERNFMRSGRGENNWREYRWNSFYALLFDEDKNKVIGAEDPIPLGESYPTGKTEEGYSRIYPINSRGEERVWRSSYKTGRKRAESGELVVSQAGTVYQVIQHQSRRETLFSNWTSPEFNAGTQGTAVLDAMGLGGIFDYPKSIKTIEKGIWAQSFGYDNATILDYFGGSGTTAHATLNINRKYGGNRKYVIAEMGAYFDSVLKPRIQKASYSESWINGAPKALETGMSQFFKYIRLESYEDALANIVLSRKAGQQQLLDEPGESGVSNARQAYIMDYMLEVETRDSQSLLSTTQFVDPTHYKLNVRTAGGDETRPINVDLLETFNYLLGLTVEYIAAPIHFDAELSQGEYGRWQAKVKKNESGKWWFRTVYGTNRVGQHVLVVWRNLPSVIEGIEEGIKLDNAVLDAVLIEKLRIRLTESQDDEVDVLYVNGDHNIAIPRDRKGEPMEQARIQLIEEAFHRLMFADTEQGV